MKQLFGQSVWTAGYVTKQYMSEMIKDRLEFIMILGIYFFHFQTENKT